MFIQCTCVVCQSFLYVLQLCHINLVDYDSHTVALSFLSLSIIIALSLVGVIMTGLLADHIFAYVVPQRTIIHVLVWSVGVLMIKWVYPTVYLLHHMHCICMDTNT